MAAAKRLTNEEVLAEYFQLMEIDPINRGVHYIDWLNIVDDDDDMDSYYGKDYFDD